MEITGHTGLICLLGSPAAHSISPMMHNEAFRLLGLDYRYLAFDVGTDLLKTVVEGLRAMHVRGFNLTMPDKNLMCELADELSPAARMIGAVNTVVNENGVLIGHCTDGVGYMRAVKDAGHTILGKKMTMLGAGGAASAICVQAALDGVAEIDVFSRKRSFVARTEQMIADINAHTHCRAHFYDLADEARLRQSIAESAILVNGTPVGMAPNTDASIITNPTMFRPGLIVSDLIYNPEKTKFLELAEQQGCAVFNGLYMLLYQGAEAFRIWTGQEMPVEAIKAKYFTR